MVSDHRAPRARAHARSHWQCYDKLPDPDALPEPEEVATALASNGFGFHFVSSFVFSVLMVLGEAPPGSDETRRVAL